MHGTTLANQGSTAPGYGKRNAVMDASMRRILQVFIGFVLIGLAVSVPLPAHAQIVYSPINTVPMLSGYMMMLFVFLLASLAFL